MIMRTKITRPKTNLMLESASIMEDICSDLKRLGITFFGHTRIFNDGTRIDLNTDPSMTEEFYYGKDKVYEFYTPDFKPKTKEEEIIFLDNVGDNLSLKFLRENYNIDHMLVKIDRRESYCDIWNFGTERDNKDIAEFYCSNINLLTLFTFFYRDKCRDLIRQCENDRIIIEEIIPVTDLDQGDEHEHYVLIEEIRNSLYSAINRYYINNNSDEHHLTKAEIECCRWIYQGKTAEEIAIIVNRSKKTIEKHIENIRAKLNCYNKSQLIKTIKQFGIF